MKSPFNPTGVVGAGYFGTAVANLLAYNSECALLFSRREDVVTEINLNHTHLEAELSRAYAQPPTWPKSRTPAI
jgi:glycerol-3-phosphate dehydrogenase